jgi:hypothetical protein
MEWVARIFEQYVKSEGKIGLEDLFGIRQKLGPKTDVFSKNKERERDLFLCIHMCILTKGFKLPVKEAAPAVADAFKDRFQSIECLAASVISSRFQRKEWKEFRERYARSPFHEQMTTDEKKRSYLMQYPLSSLPSRLHR